jgi:sodium pump decarboxylase gamma subunit
VNADTVAQGLTITVVGMGLVFLVLGLLVLTMMLMGRFLRPRDGGTPSPEPSRPGAAASPDRARVAIMAAAIALSQQRDPKRPAGGWASVVEGHALRPWQTQRPARGGGPLHEGDTVDETISDRP